MGAVERFVGIRNLDRLGLHGERGVFKLVSTPEWGTSEYLETLAEERFFLLLRRGPTPFASVERYLEEAKRTFKLKEVPCCETAKCLKSPFEREFNFGYLLLYLSSVWRKLSMKPVLLVDGFSHLFSAEKRFVEFFAERAEELGGLLVVAGDENHEFDFGEPVRVPPLDEKEMVDLLTFLEGGLVRVEQPVVEAVLQVSEGVPLLAVRAFEEMKRRKVVVRKGNWLKLVFGGKRVEVKTLLPEKGGEIEEKGDPDYFRRCLMLRCYEEVVAALRDGDPFKNDSSLYDFALYTLTKSLARDGVEAWEAVVACVRSALESEWRGVGNYLPLFEAYALFSGDPGVVSTVERWKEAVEPSEEVLRFCEDLRKGVECERGCYNLVYSAFSGMTEVQRKRCALPLARLFFLWNRWDLLLAVADAVPEQSAEMMMMKFVAQLYFNYEDLDLFLQMRDRAREECDVDVMAHWEIFSLLKEMETYEGVVSEEIANERMRTVKYAEGRRVRSLGSFVKGGIALVSLRLERAEKLLRRAISSARNSNFRLGVFYSSLFLGEIMLMRGKISEAFSFYRLAYRHGTTSPLMFKELPLFGVFMLRFYLGDPEGALGEFERALAKVDPDERWEVYAVGSVFAHRCKVVGGWNRGERVLAKKELKRAFVSSLKYNTVLFLLTSMTTEYIGIIKHYLAGRVGPGRSRKNKFMEKAREVGFPYVLLSFLHDLAVATGDRESAEELKELAVSSGARFFEVIAKGLLGDRDREFDEFCREVLRDLQTHGFGDCARKFAEKWGLEYESSGSRQGIR